MTNIGLDYGVGYLNPDLHETKYLDEEDTL